MNATLRNSYQAARILVRLLPIILRTCYFRVQLRNVVNFSEEFSIAQDKLLPWAVTFDEQFDVLWDEIKIA